MIVQNLETNFQSSVSPPVILTLPNAVTEPTSQTKPTPPRPYDPLVDDPNIIHPFPVPFLKRGPQLHKVLKFQLLFFCKNDTFRPNESDPNKS